MTPDTDSTSKLSAGSPRTTGPGDGSDMRKAAYSRLFRKFVWLTLLCSVAPLLLVGWGINLHYTRFARQRMLNYFETQVDYHRKIIVMFLNEHSSKLQIIARTHTREHLARVENLQETFNALNREIMTVTDLGLIDAQGNHLAYVGPYDLMSRNYAQEPWFQQVMEKGLFISDMFMGFRREPHFIIAVTQLKDGEKWILRTTINTDAFRALVENVRIGLTGEVYLLNREGVFQTNPRSSSTIMEKSSYPMGDRHEDILIRTLAGLKDEQGREKPLQIACEAWLKEPGWLLVVKQDYAEAFDDVNYANRWTLIFLHVSAVSILVASILITRHMITIIKRRDAQSEQLNEQVLQTGKLASIGELSAGVAHEINNPLAIILTERQLLIDAAKHLPLAGPDFREQLDDSLNQIDVQVQRCKRITHNLLRFSRRTESLIEPVDLNAFLREVVDLMDREARSGGIKFFTELDPKLPPLLSDPSQLQQVFLNLITNAIDAHDGKPYGSIQLKTRADEALRQVHVAVADTGSGIPPEHLSRIFDPFFTTKIVGTGTGLGLSICYSIVKRLGGSISVQSEKGKGTEFRILLPYTPPQELQESLAEKPGPLKRA